MATSYSLGDHYDDFIQQQLASGRFQSASEVIRAGLRKLEDDERLLAHIRAWIAEGRDSGDAGTLEEVKARRRSARKPRK